MKVGVMTDVGFGLRDLNIPCLWFTIRVDPSSAALQVFTEWVEIKRIIEESGVRDVRQLEGKACWYTSDHGIVQFKGLFDTPWS